MSVSLFKQISLNFNSTSPCINLIRTIWKPVNKPKPGVSGKSFRRIVHFPEEYTVKPLDVTNLAGRDPESGDTHINIYLKYNCYINIFFWFRSFGG